MSQKKILPLIALKDMVIFPHIMAPLSIGRDKSLNAVYKANSVKDKKIILVTQKVSATENPSKEELYDIGVIAKIRQVIPDDSNDVRDIKILVTANQRVKLTDIQDGEYFSTSYELLENNICSDLNELHLYSQKVLDKFLEYIKIDKKMSPDVVTTLKDEANDEFYFH